MKKRRLLVITVIIFSLLLLSSCNLVGEAKRVATDLDQTAQSAAEEPALRTQTPTEEHYIYGAGREARYKNGELIYTHQDYLGSSRATTDSSGEKEEDNTYLPYGESLGASSERFGFTGKEAEGELMYYGARYYDADTGRFTQKDPIGDGRNWYTYANNNPLKYIDPAGTRLQVASRSLDITVYLIGTVSIPLENYQDVVVSQINEAFEGGPFFADEEGFIHVRPDFQTPHNPDARELYFMVRTLISSDKLATIYADPDMLQGYACAGLTTSGEPAMIYNPFESEMAEGLGERGSPIEFTPGRALFHELGHVRGLTAHGASNEVEGVGAENRYVNIVGGDERISYEPYTVIISEKEKAIMTPASYDSWKLALKNAPITEYYSEYITPQKHMTVVPNLPPRDSYAPVQDIMDRYWLESW